VSEGFEAELPRERICAAIARRLVAEHYGTELTREKLDDLRLVVSELVDNAYLHGEGRIRLKLQRVDQAVHVEVMDEGTNASIKIRRLGARSGGHGLRLVDHLCSAWGAYEGSTHVWAHFAVAEA
jgi:anti-sigma regulatory factor (Ser/Thr protein kinase)